MSRTAQITLVNNLAGTMTYVSDDIVHGKVSGDFPSSIDNNGGSNDFTVTNRDAALIGPKGSVVYSVNGGGKVTIYWNHPYSGATSAYTAEGCDFVLTPANPSGHDQKVKLTLNP